MAVVKSDLATALKNAFEKLAKSKEKEDNGQGLFTSPKAAMEIASAYHSYASKGMADLCTVAAVAADFETGMGGAPTPAGLDAALAAYWKASSVSPDGATYASCVTAVLGPLSFVFANHKTSQKAADVLADALHTYTTSKVQVTAVLTAGGSAPLKIS